MSIPRRRGILRRRRGSISLPVEPGAAEYPVVPGMWLPPLRPHLPSGAPPGVLLGELKPQREPSRKPWPGPTADVMGAWNPFPPHEASQPPHRRRPWTGLAAAMLVIAAAGAGAMVAAAMGAERGATANDVPVSIATPIQPMATPTATPRPAIGEGTMPAVIPDPFALAWPPTPAPTASVTAAASLSRFQIPLKQWSSVTDRFGAPRANRVRHGGIDLALDGMPASPVYAGCQGMVTLAGYTQVYGYHVIVDCGEGWSTLHAHLRRMLVAPGDTVTFDDVIGISGQSGNAEGEHLHFEIRLFGTPVNPEHHLDFGIPPGTPLTRDRRDADGNLITPTPPETPTPAPPEPTPTATPTPTPSPTPTMTPTPRPTLPKPATQSPRATPTPTPSPQPAEQQPGR